MPIIKVEYNDETLYCALPENTTFMDVEQAVADNFSVSIQNSVVNVTDHQDAKIKSTEALRHVISKCADDINLYLKISFGDSSTRGLITPQILLKFIADNGGNKISRILNIHKATGQLTKSDRRSVLHMVIDFIVSKYGYYPKKDIKIEVAKAVVAIFPCLAKTQGNNVIEFLYAGRKGWLPNLLKSRRAKDKIVRPQNIDDDDDDDDEDCELEYSSEQATKDVEYLKMTPYDDSTAFIIEEKMKLTAMFRRNLFSMPGNNVAKQHPYMISHPHLILLDYSFMHPTNCNAFHDNWPKYSKHILSTLTVHEKDKDFFTCFLSDIAAVLALLKLVTPKPSGRQKKKKNGTTIFFKK